MLYQHRVTTGPPPHRFLSLSCLKICSHPDRELAIRGIDKDSALTPYGGLINGVGALSQGKHLRDHNAFIWENLKLDLEITSSQLRIIE